MRFGLFADVHGNLEAFEMVRRQLSREAVDEYVFLGDLVGYGADPVACIRLLREMSAEKPCLCVAGNHDYAVAGRVSSESFTFYARQAVLWTQGILAKDDLDFLAGFPLMGKTAYFRAVHASPFAPERWLYFTNINDAHQNFMAFDEPLCFIGHSHAPVVFSIAERITRCMELVIPLKRGKRYIINVGSVGQPRDGNPRAAFAIYDTDQNQVTVHRVAYEVSLAQAKIIKAGLPKILAYRLFYGK